MGLDKMGITFNENNHHHHQQQQQQQQQKQRAKAKGTHTSTRANLRSDHRRRRLFRPRACTTRRGRRGGEKPILRECLCQVHFFVFKK
tara:strand:- start:275 stop:538 length:264 start_codon:yes stop_codon:yes gene_type:complete